MLQGLLDRGEASPDKEYASMYLALEHVLCADHEEHDFAIHRVMVTLEPGDRLVLCSDGVHDELGEPALEVAEQVRVWREGAGDNLSLIVVMIES